MVLLVFIPVAFQRNIEVFGITTFGVFRYDYDNRFLNDGGLCLSHIVASDICYHFYICKTFSS